MAVTGVANTLAVFEGKLEVSWLQTLGGDHKEFETVFESNSYRKSQGMGIDRGMLIIMIEGAFPRQHPFEASRCDMFVFDSFDLLFWRKYQEQFFGGNNTDIQYFLN